MAPNFGAKVDGGEDSGGVDPDVVEDVGTKWSDEGKGMGVKVSDTREVAEEVPIDKFLLRNPKFLTAVVDDGVLVGVAVDGEGASGSGKEVGEDVG